MVDDIPRGINSGGTFRSWRRRWEMVWAGNTLVLWLSPLTAEFSRGESMAYSVVMVSTG